MDPSPENIEQVPVNSPLLAKTIIERDYTAGIESQVKTEGPVADEPIIDEPLPEEEKVKEGPKPEDTTKEFTFDRDPVPDTPPGTVDDGSTVEESELLDVEVDEPFKLPEASAKAFANVVGNLISIYAPKFAFNYSRIDMNNIRKHIREGNIHQEFEDTFEKCNENTWRALQFDPEEIKMWKKAFQEYMEYKNMAIANPETAFWVATGALGVSLGDSMIRCKKDNQKLVVDVLKTTNPEMFKDYMEQKEAEDNIDDKKEKPDGQE